MKIAIIGAGMSGIKTARLLQDSGHNVVVFEKSRGLGGRLAHRRLDWANLDLGAQYFTARDPAFISEVAGWCRHGTATLWNFTPYHVKRNQLLASPDNTLRYIGQPSMNGPVHQLGVGIDVRFGVTVNKVSRQNSWSLHGVDGRLFSGFDWLIVALPAEQAKHLLMDVSDIVTGIPESVHQPCWALGLGTLGRVSGDVQGIFGDDTVRWVSRLSQRPGFRKRGDVDDIWMLHFAPVWSQQQGKEISAADIGREGIGWLQRLLNTELTPIHEYCHFWRYASIKPLQQDSAYRVDETMGLAVIGAWCSGGRVEGAWLSAASFVGDWLASYRFSRC